MPSKIGKTTKRETTKRGVARSRSVSHRESTLEWLRKDATNAAAFLEAALDAGDAGDFMAALRNVTAARGGVAKIAEETVLNREALYRASTGSQVRVKSTGQSTGSGLAISHSKRDAILQDLILHLRVADFASGGVEVDCASGLMSGRK